MLPAQVELRICIYQLSEEPAEGEEGAEGDGVPCCAPQCLLCCKACARQLHVWWLSQYAYRAGSVIAWTTIR